jgi:uncharacterized membrane protein YsdA (DUF1294 family)/cold shock CspA family protein
MRYQGRLIEWKDDKGFGFVVQNGGEGRVFVHIKSMTNSRRRPVINDLLTYEIVKDRNGRTQATGVSIVSAKNRVAKPDRVDLTLPLFVAFLVFVVFAVLLQKLPLIVAAWYLVMSFVTAGFYAADKSSAKRNEWRTPEGTLHMLALVGGWPGALLARKYLRHKSSKPSFRQTFWATVAINGILLALLLSPAGESTRGVMDGLQPFDFGARATVDP